MNENTLIYDYVNYNLATIKQSLNEKYLHTDLNDIIIYALVQLKFNANEEILTLEIKKFTLKHKIVGYRQVNYVKYKIYDKKQMNIKDTSVLYINRKININYFCNQQLLTYHLPYWLILKICDVINFKSVYYEDLTTLINKTNALNDWKNKPNHTYHYLSYPKLKKTDYIEQPSNLKLFIALTFCCLGLNWFFYLSQNKAKKHQLWNKENKAYNAKKIQEMQIYNQNEKSKVDYFNTTKLNTIQTLTNEIKVIKDKWFNPSQNTSENLNSEEWMDLRIALSSYHNQYDNTKGVYIIWNTTKNKYYVGQSKNVGKRIFHQHFNIYDNDVKNIIFAKDWYNNDDFKFKVIIYGDKETNLDNLEKEYINKYDAFNHGYNKTNGNA